MPNGCHASWMRGKTCSTSPRLANSSSTSSGMLRTISTYVVHTERSTAFRDSRPIPISVPSTVASTSPATATRSVFRKPWISASLTGAVCDIRCRGSRSSRADRGTRSRSGCSCERRWCGSWSTTSRAPPRRCRAQRAGRSSAAHEHRATAAVARTVCNRFGMASVACRLSRFTFACQRYGGLYISPPSVHSALTPRSRPSGVRWRSKISP